MLIIPLVFFSLVSGISSLTSMKSLGNITLKTITLYLSTTAIAVTLSLIVGSIFKPGSGYSSDIAPPDKLPEGQGIYETILDIFPSNIIEAMAQMGGILVMSKLDDPFRELSNEQVLDFDFLITTQNMRQQKFLSEVDEAFEEAIEIRYKLERQGLDVDGLISDFRQLEKEIERRNKTMNTQINNELVRIPGYALPLEHQGTAVRELLLVPYVGACIHVPPPPANQTVYVKLNNAHAFNNLYEPVWITGRISIKATRQKLYLVDGSADVDTGYTLEGIKIEPYETE